jgi:hypothetical protein
VEIELDSGYRARSDGRRNEPEKLKRNKQTEANNEERKNTCAVPKSTVVVGSSPGLELKGFLKEKKKLRSLESYSPF